MLYLYVKKLRFNYNWETATEVQILISYFPVLKHELLLWDHLYLLIALTGQI